MLVHDRQTGINERVSVSSAGVNSYGGSASISADGRYVSFESNAKNLTDSDIADWYPIFVHDRESGMTQSIWNPLSRGQ